MPTETTKHRDTATLFGDPVMQVKDRIISAKERRTLVPYCDVHIRRMERAGKFPKRIRLGEHRVGWSLREVEEWIEARKAERGV